MLRARSLAVCLLVGVTSVAGLVCGLSVAHQRKSEPFYQGKPLEYWFNQLPMTRIDGAGFYATVIQSDHMLLRRPSGAVRKYGGWTETPEASANAIRGIGTNALAFYLQKLRRHVGTREIQIEKVARAFGFHGFLFEGVDPERGQAVTALILLKPLPPEVVSKLATLTTNRNRDIAAAAHWALTTKEKELVLLHPPDSKESVDVRLLKIPISPGL
jgi:hypothetical protein